MPLIISAYHMNFLGISSENLVEPANLGVEYDCIGAGFMQIFAYDEQINPAARHFRQHPRAYR
jgi:hypothetical protein